MEPYSFSLGCIFVILQLQSSWPCCCCFCRCYWCSQSAKLIFCITLCHFTGFILIYLVHINLWQTPNADTQNDDPDLYVTLTFMIKVFMCKYRYWLTELLTESWNPHRINTDIFTNIFFWDSIIFMNITILEIQVAKIHIAVPVIKMSLIPAHS